MNVFNLCLRSRSLCKLVPTVLAAIIGFNTIYYILYSIFILCSFRYYDILKNPGTYMFVKSTKRHFEVSDLIFDLLASTISYVCWHIIGKVYKLVSLILLQVQTRIWPCWRVVCNCGVAIRENNDVVTIDMCNGQWGRTVPRVIQKSRKPLGNRIKIKSFGAGQRTRYKVCVNTLMSSKVWNLALFSKHALVSIRMSRLATWVGLHFDQVHYQSIKAARPSSILQ